MPLGHALSLTGTKSRARSCDMDNPYDSCPTPVLFLIQRRPDLTARVLAAIRSARPAHLMLAADGPEEDDRCQETRRLVLDGIDWPCQVHTRFSPTRLGCREAISQALDWGFALHERLIVVEDDCLPELSFFRFCTELLDRYQDDEKVMQICGSNLSGHAAQDGSSYYASRFDTIWGWASWRRAWQKHDSTLASWPAVRSSAAWRQSCRFKGEQAWRRQLYDSAHSGGLDAWSVAWMYAKEKHGGLALIASNNLVSNLGWGEGATHTHDQNDPRACMKTVPVEFPLRHAKNLVPDDRADLNYFIRFCRAPSLASRVINKLYRIWRQMWA